LKKSFFLISFILLALCFLPALTLPFAHHDNVRFFSKFYCPASDNPQKRDPQYFLAYLIGRPLTAEIHQIIFTHVSSIRDLTLVRWLTVTVFAICAGLLANIFDSFGLSFLESLGLSVAIFILPGVQDGMLMLGIQNALAVWATLWAYLVSCKSYKSRLEDLFNGSVFFCLMLASMLLYPQWSFFVFVPVLVKYMILSDPKGLSAIRKQILHLLVFFSVTAVFYFFYIKIFVITDDSRAGTYAFTINFNFLFWKILSVFSKILPMAFNFWNFQTITWLGLAIMGVTLVLLKRKTIICFLLIGWTLGFWLLIPSDLILHRIFYVTSVMALAVFLMGIRKFNKYLIMGAMTIGLIGVHYLTFFNAVNYNIEFSYIRQSLLNHRHFSRIHVVQVAPNGKGYDGLATVDDIFNAKTANYYFMTDTLNLVRGALRDIHYPDSVWIYSCESDQKKCVEHMPKGYRLLITHTNKNQPIYYSPDMVLIDMNDL